jgi:hypothetical protein
MAGSSKDALDAVFKEMQLWAVGSGYTSSSLNNYNPNERATMTLHSGKLKAQQLADCLTIQGFHRVSRVAYVSPTTLQ